MKNIDPFEVTEDYVEAVCDVMKERIPDNAIFIHDPAAIKNVLLANWEVQRRVIHDGELDKWRDVYAFYIPGDVLIDMLRTLAWATAHDNDYYPVTLVTFKPTPPDTEDSYFEVLDSDNNLKTSLAEAIKLAYFKFVDKRKEQRREKYLELKKEFEPQ